MFFRALTTILPMDVEQLLTHELLGPSVQRSEPIEDPPGLQVCVECLRPFVVPGAARELVGVDRVRLDLVCTNCGTSRSAIHHDSELAAFEQQLDRSFADLLWTLEIVWVANEEAAIERFAAALNAGAILPEDF